MNDKKIKLLLIAMLLAVSNASYCAGTNNESVILKAAEQKEQVTLQTQENVAENADENSDAKKVKANKELLEKAQAEFDNKDFQSAIVHSTIYINSKPKKYEAYKLRGDAFYELRQFKLAEKDYQTAVDLKKSDDKFMTNTKYVGAVILGADKNEQLQNTELGNLYGRLMYAQKAQNNPKYEEAYENAIKYNSHIYLPEPKKSDINLINCPQKYGKAVNPQGIDANIYGAINDIENENYNEALYKLQKVTQEYPKYYQGYYLTGVALAGLDQYDNAIHSFEQALKYNPYDFESMASLGQIYYNKSEISFSEDDSKKSIDYFKQALKYNKNSNTYYFYNGLNRLQTGNINLAINNFTKALKINPNDYNSIYYKAIANYMKGDYSVVVDDTTKLIYKHVSNYNSVLYLRALAYYKIGAYERALADLDNIHNSINDIYNSDVKVVTEKEKTLESYVYYLRDKIARAQGKGDRANLANAYKNPIIAKLAQAENSIAPYEKALSGANINLSDYKKFEDYYNTSLPKLLQSNIVITLNDIDNQYDYIRTTFDDLGISFRYKNPDYTITTIKNYPYKKYSSKLSKEDLASVSGEIPSEEKEVYVAPKTTTMKQQTSQKDMIGEESQPSLAQLLASNSLLNSSRPAPKKPIARQIVNDDINESIADFQPQIPEAEKTDTSSNIASGEPFIYVDKPSKVDKENAKNVEEILKEEKTIAAPSEVKISDKTGGVKISAAEYKDTSDVTISYVDTRKKMSESVKQEEKQQDYISSIAKKTEPKVFSPESVIIPENPEQTVAYKQASSIVEKRATDAVPMVYSASAKPYPVLSGDEEVIELKADDFMKNLNENMAKEQNKVAATVTDLQNSINKSLKTVQEDISEPITIEQTVAEAQKEIKESVPVVVVPELEGQPSKISRTVVEDTSKEIEEKISDVELRPAVSIASSEIKENTEKPVDVMRGDYTLPEKTVKAEDQNTAKEVVSVFEQKKQEVKEVEESPYLTKEKVKAEKAKIRENLKARKEQLKKAQKQAKEEAKAKAAQQKAMAKAEKERAVAKAKAEAQLQKDEAARVKEALAAQMKEKEYSKEIEKEKQKAQQEIEKAQAKVEDQKAKIEAKLADDDDEAKVARIKELTEEELTKQEKAAQKAQLKAERAQAKAELKARKAAEKAQAKAQKELNEVNASTISKKPSAFKKFLSKFKHKN